MPISKRHAGHSSVLMGKAELALGAKCWLVLAGLVRKRTLERPLCAGVQSQGAVGQK